MADLNRNLAPRRHAWLMTDERIGDALIASLLALPPGAGVVFRHRHLPARERRALFLRVRRIAHARRLRISASGPLPGAPAHGGMHRALTYPAHDRRQAVAGCRAGADWLLVSPIHPTRSHPGSAALGIRRAAAVPRGLGRQAIALGGMTPHRWLALRRFGFAGWAGIDALTAQR